MNRRNFIVSFAIAVAATLFMLWQDGAFAAKPEAATSPSDVGAVQQPTETIAAVTAQIDRVSVDNGGTITVTGTAPVGKSVYLEIWADEKVRASRFDADPDPKTGQRPYILYMTEGMPSYYKVIVPKDKKDAIEAEKKQGGKWSVSKLLKDTGADAIYSAPTTIKIDRYQAALMGSIIGSRGDLLPAMDEKENARRSMQLLKARFRSVGNIMSPDMEVNPDGSFKAVVEVREGLAPGKYTVVAAVDKTTKSRPLTFENKIAFPTVYMSNAGTSINIFWPALLTFAVTTFGVLMGAGGGFILNPLLVSIWPLPHTVVAGTVMPTVLFSQGSGIYNYSKIHFINWKLGATIGCAMLAGGFIGPKLTEMVTLDQYKFVFGWILIILASLMAWQTTPGYLAKNKKEQAILKEFQKRAKECSAQKDQCGGKI